jgi:CubicO group peptidase (beta-lactamase class C family)
MLISRRGFTRGALSAVLGSQFAAPAFAQNSKYAAALAAISAYAQAHVRQFGLPGITLALTTADGLSTVLNFGYANLETRAPITPNTLWQIGSISKLMNAAVIHQLASEGRLRLTDRISDLVPQIPLPAGNSIEVQHLLDHSAGLAADAPTFPQGGLWTAYAPGAHWHYSNTGYDILGKLIEHVSGKPLARVVQDRILTPLGMRRSLGAILAADRTRYAQGYEAADQLPFAIGVPLAPAAWVDVTTGAANVASTGEDMIRLLRSIADAAQGRSGLGLSSEGARAFTTHAVPSDERAMAYGNGLMHTAYAGRAYLHHTGGVISFSSSFHVDVASGAGAFASSNISAFVAYRPRTLTQFAVDALTNAASGRPMPKPAPLQMALMNPASYVGSYSGPRGAFEIRAGDPLTIVANGQSASLQPWGGELFRTSHPSFRTYSLLFERKATAIVGASWGPATYVHAGSAGRLPPSNPALAKLAGRYVNDNPWFGLYEVVERGGRLWIGTETMMERLGENLWRIGAESWTPERGSFADFVDGRPQTFIFSGEKFQRHDA